MRPSEEERWFVNNRGELQNMTSKDRLSRLWESLRNKDYRDAFVSEHINSGIAVQISENRLARAWTQRELGRRASMGQVSISKLESASRGTPNLSTLLRLASAFDCGLMVKFVPLSQLAALAIDPDPLVVPRFGEDSPGASRYEGWAHREENVAILPTESTATSQVSDYPTLARQIASASTPVTTLMSESTPKMEAR